MRITLVQGAFLPVPPLLGGAVEKVWFALGQEFARRGHAVTHLSRAHPSLPATETIGGVLHRRLSGFNSPATTAARLLLDCWYALRVRANLPPADILVTNSFWLPALVTDRTRGQVYVHVARQPKGQLKLYRRAVLQTVSQAVRDSILAELPSAAARVRVIPYPLSTASQRPAPGPGGHTVLYVGRVHPEKGVHLLIDAFARIAPAERAAWKLKIVGPAETALGGGETYLAQLRATAARSGAAVAFTGPEFDETRLNAHYENADLFAYPSLAERGETFGLAALEAMSAGCAPVVSALACFRDFIRPGDNGLTFDHRAADPAAALAAVLAPLLRDAPARQHLRQAAWLTTRDYTLQKIAGLFLDDFATLCPAAPRAPGTALPAAGA